MYHNGVTHMVVEDDLKGVGAILRWLSYIPCRKGAPLPYTPHTDHIERPLASFPTRQTLNHLLFPPRSANDPRIMLEAFFDKVMTPSVHLRPCLLAPKFQCAAHVAGVQRRRASASVWRSGVRRSSRVVRASEAFPWALWRWRRGL